MQEDITDDVNNNNSITKLFTNNHNQIIAVSDKGAVFYHAINESTQPVASVYDLQTTQTDIMYDKHKNMLLLGEGLNLHIIDFRTGSATIRYIPITAPHLYFTIKAIDTSDSHILISDIKPEHYFDVSKNREHKKMADCCKKNAIPYDRRPNCANCTQMLSDYHNQKITIIGTPDEITKRLQGQEPIPCTHKLVPDLPESCAQQTMILCPWDNLIEHGKDQQQELCPTNICTFEDKTHGGYDGHKVIMYALLTSNKTLLIHSKSGNDGHSGFSSHIDECSISGLPSELAKITNFHGRAGWPRDTKLHWLKSNKGTVAVYTNFFYINSEKLPKHITGFFLYAPQENRQTPLSYYIKTWPKYAFIWSIEQFYHFIYLAIDLFVLFPMDGIASTIFKTSKHTKIIRSAQKNNPAMPLCFCIALYCLYKTIL